VTDTEDLARSSNITVINRRRFLLEPWILRLSTTTKGKNVRASRRHPR